MSAELNLVMELAIILIAASVFTVISKALKQPLILGYIIAGFIVGPHLGLFPQFSPESVHQWSELGIIFLLFGLGLEFNFKKLLNVGSAALIAALTICLGMFAMGYLTGTALHWSNMESIFLGGMMGMSSTTIIIKAYDDLGIKNAPHSSLVFGLLVVEDLLAVLILVLFSTLAVSNKFSGVDMLMSLGKLVVFLVLCFVTGIYVIPSLLRKAGKFISDEIMLLISIGLCFLMVVLANKAGFSSALGAFLIGSILSSTIEGERIEHLTVSIKNLFGAIFFVSVGMMVDPAVIAHHWPVILVITLVAMLGILTFSTTGVLLAGKSLDTALHVGFSLPQLGEFSFIIAGLGTSLGVISDFIYPVIISVSVITTFTTPYMIKAADPVSAWLHRKLPANVMERLNRRSSKAGGKDDESLSGLWKVFLRKYVVRVSVYCLLLIVIELSLKEYLPKFTAWCFPDMKGWLEDLVQIAIALAVIFPFLYGLAVKSGELGKLSAKIVKREEKYRNLITAAVFLRVFLAVDFTLSVITTFADLPSWTVPLICVAMVFALLIARGSSRRLSRMEDKFITNLNAKEDFNIRNAPVEHTVNTRLGKYDIHTGSIEVLPGFEYAGEPLRKMPFRNESGVNIAKIKRGRNSILIPSGDERIFPGDLLVAVGSTEQLDSFVNQMKACYPLDGGAEEEFIVEPLTIDSESLLYGLQLKDTNLRADGCLVVSVERGGEHFTNPHKDFIFEAGDIVWVAGQKSSIEKLKR